MGSEEGTPCLAPPRAVPGELQPQGTVVKSIEMSQVELL